MRGVDPVHGDVVTELVYDGAGRLIKAIYPDDDGSGVGTVLYGYDAAGDLTARTDQNGLLTTYDRQSAEGIDMALIRALMANDRFWYNLWLRNCDQFARYILDCGLVAGKPMPGYVPRQKTTRGHMRTATRRMTLLMGNRKKATGKNRMNAVSSKPHARRQEATEKQCFCVKWLVMDATDMYRISPLAPTCA